MSILNQLVAAFIIFCLVAAIGIMAILGIMARKTKVKGESLRDRLGADA